MGRTIQRRVRIGKDRVLHMQLPDDIAPGEVDVTVREPAPAGGERAGQMSEAAQEALRRLLDPDRVVTTDPEERRRAAEAGMGILAGEPGDTLEDFLRERREDDARRDRALGL